MSYFKRKGFLVLPPVLRSLVTFSFSPWTTCVTTGWGGEGEGGGGREIEGEHGGDKKKMEHGYICFALAFLVAAILYLIDPNPNPNPNPNLNLNLEP